MNTQSELIGNGMTEEASSPQVLSEAFYAALLLTGSSRRAEAALLEASTRGNSAEPAFLNEVIAASLDSCGEAPLSPAETELASAILPVELQAVLRLSVHQRCCYVLRFMLGRSRESCARLLSLNIGQMDQHTYAALLRMPALQSSVIYTATWKVAL